jgi:hypothetical protein
MEFMINTRLEKKPSSNWASNAIDVKLALKGEPNIAGLFLVVFRLGCSADSATHHAWMEGATQAFRWLRLAGTGLGKGRFRQHLRRSGEKSSLCARE